MRTLIVALALAAGAPLLAQEPQVGPPRPHPPIGPGGPGGQGGPGGAEQEAREEMIELFQSVEARLQEIDELLYEASSGRGGLAGTEELVIGELLNSSSSKSEEVLSGIDRILEIAEQFGQGQGGGSGGSVEQAMGSGQSPLDGQPQGEQGQKEQAPEAEDQQAAGEEPQREPQGSPDQPGSERPGGQRPDDPGQEPEGRPENRDATDQPPSGETGRVQVTDTTERWGDLPVHVRDLFRNEGGGDLPAQYRDWIDGYYRRLNRRK